MRKWKFLKSEKAPKEKAPASQKNVFEPSPSFESIFQKAKNPENEQRYLRLLRELERSDSLNDPKILQKLITLSLSPWDDRTYNSLYYALNQSQLENILVVPDPFQEPSRKQLLQSGYQIGLTLNDKIPVFLHPEKIYSHTLILGATGTGKTECSKQIVSEINQKSPATGIFIFDLYKNEYRSLIHRIPDLIICPVEEIKLCHLQPPSGVPVEKHISRWVDVFCETFGLPQFTRMMLRNTADRLVHQFLERYHEKIYPALSDIIQALEAEHGGEARFVIERLDYLRRAFGKEYCRAWDTSQLAHYKICWEINRWEKPIQEYFVKKLTADLFSSNIENTHGNQPVIILLDEAHRILGEGSALDEIVCVARGAKIGLIVSSQQSSNISPAILANAAVKICGRMEWFELERLKKYLALTEEQVAFLRTHHTVGLFLIKYSYGDFQEPLLCQSLYAKFPTVSATDAFRNLRLLDALQTILRDEIPEIHVSVPPENKKPFQEEVSVKKDEPDVPKDMHRFLKRIAEHPFEFSTDHFKALNLSMRQGISLKNEAIERGFIREHVVEGVRGGRPLVFELLDKVEQMGITKPKFESKGGFLHAWYVEAVASYYLRLNAQIFREYENIDLVAFTKDGKRIAVEVELALRPHIYLNIGRNFSLGYDEVIVVCKNNAIRLALQRKAKNAENFNEKVHFRLISYFLK